MSRCELPKSAMLPTKGDAKLDIARSWYRFGRWNPHIVVLADTYCQVLSPEGVRAMAARKPAPRGYRWVFCRYRRVRNSQRILDAHDYGYEAWVFLTRAK